MGKFKVGDTVKITAGKDKGREGKIEKVFPRENLVLIPGINIFKKHLKKTPGTNQKGGIFDIPRPISNSKIALICPKCKKITRVGFKIFGEEKTRICKKCGGVI